jgi:hypothetical protein
VAANIPEKYVPSQEQRMDLYRRIALIRTEEEADDLTDEIIDRFGDPPASVNTLVLVALLRGEAGRAGITDITQKSGALRFTVDDFDMERVSALYARPEYKGRLCGWRRAQSRLSACGFRPRPGSSTRRGASFPTGRSAQRRRKCKQSSKPLPRPRPGDTIIFKRFLRR